MIWGRQIIIIENIWSPAKNIVQSILCVIVPETPIFLCVPASLSTDTLWVTPRSPSVCSRVWSRWSTPSPSTTWAASSLTTLWAKSPADSGSTNSRLTKTVSAWASFRHVTEREGCFISTQLLTITSPHLCHYWAIARSHLSHPGLVVCSGYYAGRPFGLPFMKYPHNPIYLFNNSLLPQWLGAVCDNVSLALVQISHTTRWWMPEPLSSVRYSR